MQEIDRSWYIYLYCSPTYAQTSGSGRPELQYCSAERANAMSNRVSSCVNQQDHGTVYTYCMCGRTDLQSVSFTQEMHVNGQYACMHVCIDFSVPIHYDERNADLVR
jgi:hypothetical protein